MTTHNLVVLVHFFLHVLAETAHAECMTALAELEHLFRFAAYLALPILLPENVCGCGVVCEISFLSKVVHSFAADAGLFGLLHDWVDLIPSHAIYIYYYRVPLNT